MYVHCRSEHIRRYCELTILYASSTRTEENLSQVTITMPSLASTAPTRTEQPCPPGSWDVHHHIFDLDKFPLAPTRHFTPSSAPLHSFETFQHSLGIDHACVAHGLSFGTDPSSLLYYLKYFNGTGRAYACIDIEKTTDEQIHSMKDQVGNSCARHSMNLLISGIRG